MYSFRITEQYEYDTLLSVAKAKSIHICELYLKEGWRKWPYFIYRPTLEEVLGAVHSSRSCTLEEMLKLLTGHEKPVVTVKLTSEYDAIIHKYDKVIKVGCQTIPFSKVEELYSLIKDKL